MRTRPLAIVGMRRSGTSSISLGLSRLGVSFGPEANLFKADGFNEEGYWEHRALTAVHRMFRMSLNLASVEIDPLPPDWLDRPATEHLVARAARVLSEQFAYLGGVWAWKDPDASTILPFVSAYTSRAGYPEPHVLVCVRNPADVARSELRRRGAPEIETLGAWLAQTLGALKGSTPDSRSVVLFEDFLQNPRASLSKVVEAIELAPTDQAWSECEASVRRELAHSSAPDSLGNLPALVSRLYSLCASAVRGEIEAEAFEDGIETCDREWQGYRAMANQPQIERATLGALWERGGEQQHAEVEYRPTRGWQRVAIETNALPGSTVQLFVYALPARVWVRNATWRNGAESWPAVLESGRSSSTKHEFGVQYFTLLHGPDQITVKAPIAKGPFTLDIEVLIETSPLITGETFRWLSEAIQKLP